MSVRNETYLLIGVDLNLLDKSSEVMAMILEDLEFPWCGRSAAGTCGVLFDAMSGEYIMAGYCLAVTDEETGGFDRPLVFDFENQPTVFTEAASKFSHWMQEHNLWKFTDQTVRLHVLSHYH